MISIKNNLREIKVETIGGSWTALHRKLTKKLNWIIEFTLKNTFSMNTPQCQCNSYSNICIQNIECRKRRVCNGVPQPRYNVDVSASMTSDAVHSVNSCRIEIHLIIWKASSSVSLACLINRLPFRTPCQVHIYLLLPFFFLASPSTREQRPLEPPTHQTQCLRSTGIPFVFRTQSSWHLSARILWNMI